MARRTSLALQLAVLNRRLAKAYEELDEIDIHGEFNPADTMRYLALGRIIIPGRKRQLELERRLRYNARRRAAHEQVSLRLTLGGNITAMAYGGSEDSGIAIDLMLKKGAAFSRSFRLHVGPTLPEMKGGWVAAPWEVPQYLLDCIKSRDVEEVPEPARRTAPALAHEILPDEVPCVGLKPARRRSIPKEVRDAA